MDKHTSDSVTSVVLQKYRTDISEKKEQSTTLDGREYETTKSQEQIEQNFINFVTALQGKFPSFIHGIERLPYDNEVTFLTTTQEGAEFENFKNEATLLNKGFVTFTFETVPAFIEF